MHCGVGSGEHVDSVFQELTQVKCTNSEVYRQIILLH